MSCNVCERIAALARHVQHPKAEEARWVCAAHYPQPKEEAKK